MVKQEQTSLSWLDAEINSSVFSDRRHASRFKSLMGFVNGMVAPYILCHSGTINRHYLSGAAIMNARLSASIWQKKFSCDLQVA